MIYATYVPDWTGITKRSHSLNEACSLGSIITICGYADV